MGTAHKKVDTGAIDAEITQNHHHPPLTYNGPSGRWRMSGLTFGSGAVGQNVVVGTVALPVTYNIVAALGAPGPGVVEVLVQGSVDQTVRKMAQAIAGVTDAVNIRYGAGTQPHPDVYGQYTSQRFSIGASAHAAGSSIVFQEKIADQTDAGVPLTLTTTTVGSTLTVFTRTYTTRYLMTGNAAALGNRVAGAYQTMIPMGAVRDTGGNLVYYDPNIIVVEAIVSAGRIVECDLYYSGDEVTFTLLAAGIDLSRDTMTQGSQEYTFQCGRVPPGAGLYAKMRSDGTLITDWIDIKIQIHTYPLGV